MTGHVVYSFSIWLMLVVLAKMSGPDAMGHFAIGLAIATPLFVLSNLALRGGYVSDVTRDFEFGHYLGLRLMLIPTTLLVVGAIILALGRGATASTIMFCSALLCASSGLSDILYAVPHRAEDMRQIGCSRITKGILGIVTLVAVLALKGSVALGLAGVVAVRLLHTCFYDLPRASRMETIRPAWHGDRFRGMIRLMIPMGFASSLDALTMQLPAFGIEHYHGAAALGFFSGVVAILAVIRVASLALGETAIPRLARLHTAGDRSGFWRWMGRMLLFPVVGGVGLIIGAMVLGRPYLRLAFTPEFAEYYPELIAAAATGTLLGCAVLFGQGLTAIRSFRSKLLVVSAGLLAGFLVVVVAVPVYGVMGGVLVLATVSAVWAALSGAVLVVVAAR